LAASLGYYLNPLVNVLLGRLFLGERLRPLQMVAVDALSEKSDEYLAGLRQKYKARGEFLVELLDKELGWKIEKPKASMFLWTKLPKQFAHLTSFEFCQKIQS
jgi:alanine-synthesizing transaminase